VVSGDIKCPPLTTSTSFPRGFRAARARPPVAHGVEHCVERRQINRTGFQTRQAIITKVNPSPSVRARNYTSVSTKAQVQQRWAHGAKVQFLPGTNGRPNRVAVTTCGWRECLDHAGRLPDGREESAATLAIPKTSVEDGATARKRIECQSFCRAASQAEPAVSFCRVPASPRFSPGLNCDVL